MYGRREEHAFEAIPEYVDQFKHSVENLFKLGSGSIQSRLSQLHDKNRPIYFLLLDYLMFVSKSLREEAAIVITTDKIESEKHRKVEDDKKREDPVLIYNCMKSESVVMVKLVDGLENYRDKGKPDPSSTPATDDDEVFGFLLGLSGKLRRKVSRFWKTLCCLVYKKPLGFALTTITVWTGLILLMLQFFDFFKDASFVTILKHFDEKIIEGNYTAAYIRRTS